MLIRLNKIGTKVLKWLKERGASTDNARRILQALHVRDGFIEVADGFKIFAAPTPEGFEEVEQGALLSFGKIPAGDNILEPEKVDGEFPDTDELIKGIVETENQEGAIVIGLNSRYLQDFLVGLPKGEVVKFTISGTHRPIRMATNVEGNNPRFGVLMPMQIVANAEFYNPYGLDEKAPTPTVHHSENNGKGDEEPS